MDLLHTAMLQIFSLITASISNYHFLIIPLIYISGFLIYRTKCVYVHIFSWLSGLSGIAAILLTVLIFKRTFLLLNQMAINNNPDFKSTLSVFSLTFYASISCLIF